MGLLITETVLVEAVFRGFVGATEIGDWLRRIERLIERRQPFFFVSHTVPDTEFVEDYRSLQAHWWKRHKPAFRTYCRGLVRIANSPEDGNRLDTPALHAAWGVPYFVTTDRDAGLRWIAGHLHQERADEAR